MKLLYSLYPATELLSEYRIAVKLVSKYACRKILDIGCGKGNLAKLLANKGLEGMMYVGMDLDVGKFVRNLPGCVECVVADANYSPARTEAFDCVLFVNSIFYVGLEILGTCNPKNVVIVIDIDPRYPHVWLIDMLESRFAGLRMNKEELVKKLRDMGFDILETGGWATYYVVAKLCNSHACNQHARAVNKNS